jgi:hypothetical protein
LEADENLGSLRFTGAGDRFRTDDLVLGKHTLYQLSYTRSQFETLGSNRLFVTRAVVNSVFVEMTLAGEPFGSLRCGPRSLTPHRSARLPQADAALSHRRRIVPMILKEKALLMSWYRCFTVAGATSGPFQIVAEFYDYRERCPSPQERPKQRPPRSPAAGEDCYRGAV